MRSEVKGWNAEWAEAGALPGRSPPADQFADGSAGPLADVGFEELPGP